MITNDAGIKEGENYFYIWDILFSAIDAQIPKIGQGREMAVTKYLELRNVPKSVILAPFEE